MERHNRGKVPSRGPCLLHRLILAGGDVLLVLPDSFYLRLPTAHILTLSVVRYSASDMTIKDGILVACLQSLRFLYWVLV